MVRMEALVVQEALEASCQVEGVACPGGGVRAFHEGAWGGLASQVACCDLWIKIHFISPSWRLHAVDTVTLLVHHGDYMLWIKNHFISPSWRLHAVDKNSLY